ncbi:hypothetical protein AtNW77_Chr5g0143351 [Arabidopsis thaliana]
MAKEEAASLRQQLVIGPSCSKSLCFIYWLWKSRGFCLVIFNWIWEFFPQKKLDLRVGFFTTGLDRP